MEYATIFQAINQGQWQTLEPSLAELIRQRPNDPIPLAQAAHISLCQGQPQRARVLAQKALGLLPECTPAYVESALADLYQGDLERSYQALRRVSLSDVPIEHPAHLARTLLCIIFDDVTPQLEADATGLQNQWSAMLGVPALVDALMALVRGHEINSATWPVQEMPNQAYKILANGNRLLANLFGKLCQIIAPNCADSFLAIGVIDLHLGFLESASRALHEASYRQTSTPPSLLWLAFKLYSRLERYTEAIDIANQLISANAMTLDGMGYYIDLLVRCKADISAIERCLHDSLKFDGAAQHPGIKVASLRLALATKQQTPESILDALNQQIDLAHSAPGLYLQAALITDSNPERAKTLAEQAIALEPFHPDAARWLNPDSNQTKVFEYMGLFLPTEHEGCAWPNKLQTELLQVIFAATTDGMRNGWQAFLDRHTLERLDAGCYRLLPLLHSRLTRLCPNTHWPRREMLKGVWKKSFLENATRLKTIMALTQTLESNGIKYLLLKGLANAIDLYGDLGARPMSDIDILITPDDLALCHQILTERGWQTQTPPVQQRIRFQYASTYLHPDGGNLDLHWRPAEDFTTDDYNAADLGDRKTISWMGQSIHTLNPTTNLACTILHGVAWNHLSPVRWVSDALLLLKQHQGAIEWGQFETLTQRYHFSHITRAGLRYLVEHFTEAATLVPKDLYNQPLTQQEERLLNIRCRSRTEPASLEDLLVLFDALNLRFKLGPNDQRWACASHLSTEEIQTLANHGIRWIPVYDAMTLESQLAKMGVKNCLFLDGNLNGYLRTLSATAIN